MPLWPIIGPRLRCIVGFDKTCAVRVSRRWGCILWVQGSGLLFVSWQASATGKSPQPVLLLGRKGTGDQYHVSCQHAWHAPIKGGSWWIMVDLVDHGDVDHGDVID